MTTWKKVMGLKSKDNRHRGVANTLNQSDITTLLATADFFGASDSDLAQMAFDLKIARYRVFDWLAMAIMGRIENKASVKVFSYSLLKVDGDITKFIEDLQINDYDIYTEWENVNLEM